MTDNIRLTIMTPERVLVDKMVSKVSVPATKGRFMVLRNHAPVISSLESGKILFTCGDSEENVEIESGFVEVADNNVMICAEL